MEEPTRTWSAHVFLEKQHPIKKVHLYTVKKTYFNDFSILLLNLNYLITSAFCISHVIYYCRLYLPHQMPKVQWFINLNLLSHYSIACHKCLFVGIFKSGPSPIEYLKDPSFFFFSISLEMIARFLFFVHIGLFL